MAVRDKTEQVMWRRDVFHHWGDGWTYVDKVKAIKIYRRKNALSYNLSKQDICKAFDWLIDQTIGKEEQGDET